MTVCVLLVSLSVVLAACGLSTSRPHGAVVAPSERLEGGPTPATPVAGPFDEVARSAALKFTVARFAGVALADNVLTIYVSGTDKRDPATFDGHPVKHVRYSLVELETAKSHVDSVAERLNSSGHTLFEWGVDVATNSVKIVVLDPKADSVAAITLLGSGPYRFVAGSQASTN